MQDSGKSAAKKVIGSGRFKAKRLAKRPVAMGEIMCLTMVGLAIIISVVMVNKYTFVKKGLKVIAYIEVVVNGK